MVIWIVFIAVDYNVDSYPHYTPQPGIALRGANCNGRSVASC